MEPKRYKPSQVATLLSLDAWTVRRLVREGKIPHVRSDSGRIFIPASWVEQQTGEQLAPSNTRCVIYARESSSEHKAALKSQTTGLRQYATARGYQIVRVVQEVGSGMNDERPKLHKLLASRDFDVLLVEHKDRLTRFGFRWFEALCPFRLEVVNIAEDKTTDLMEDLVAILTSFAARLYGQRRGRKKTQAAVKAFQEAQ
jgi:putative resolvase